MRKIYIIFLILIGLLLFLQWPVEKVYSRSIDSTQSMIEKNKTNEYPWEPIGPSGGLVLSLDFNPQNIKEMYAITPYRVYKSKNTGRRWKKIAELNSHIFDLTVFPGETNIIYGTKSDGILKSENKGVNWEEFNFNIRDFEGCQLAVDPINPRIMYTAGYYGEIGYRMGMALVSSKNKGKDWKLIKLTRKYGYAVTQCIAINPFNPDIIYAGGGYSRGPKKQFYLLFKSKDKGKTWEDCTGDIDSEPRSIVLDPDNPDKIYVGTSYNVFRSCDGGQTWKKNEGEVEAEYLVIDPYNSSNLYAGGREGKFYRSTDGGINWAFSSPGLIGDCTEIAVVPFYGSPLLFYSSETGIYKSSDQGTSWTKSYREINALDVAAVSAAPSSSNILYVSVNDVGFYKSQDGGKSWKKLKKLRDSFGLLDIYQIAVSPNNPDKLFVREGWSGGQLYKSEDGGETWKCISNDFGPGYDYVEDFEISSHNEDHVFTIYRDYVKNSVIFCKTTDGGNNWEKYDIVKGPSSEEAAAVSPNDEKIVYAGFYYKRSLPLTFNNKSSGMFKPVLYKSVDGGKSWTETGWNYNSSIEDIALDPVSSSTVYVGTGDGVYISRDGGSTWAEPNLNFFHTNIIKIDPSNPRRIFAAGWGIWVSHNKGRTWISIEEGLPSRVGISYMDIAKQNPFILVGTMSHSVFKMDINELQ